MHPHQLSASRPHQEQPIDCGDRDEQSCRLSTSKTTSSSPRPVGAKRRWYTNHRFVSALPQRLSDSREGLREAGTGQHPSVGPSYPASTEPQQRHAGDGRLPRRLQLRSTNLINLHRHRVPRRQPSFRLQGELSRSTLPPIDRLTLVTPSIPNTPSINRARPRTSHCAGEAATLASRLRRVKIPLQKGLQDTLDESSCSFGNVKLKLYPNLNHVLSGQRLEGRVSITVGGDRGTVHQNTEPIALHHLNVELAGVEQTSKGSQSIFLHITKTLIGNGRPPSASLHTLNARRKPQIQQTWVTNLEFHLRLPNFVGPGPFTSRYGSIRYVLSCRLDVQCKHMSVYLKDAIDVLVLPRHDRELG